MYTSDSLLYYAKGYNVTAILAAIDVFNLCEHLSLNLVCRQTLLFSVRKSWELGSIESMLNLSVPL